MCFLTVLFVLSILVTKTLTIYSPENTPVDNRGVKALGWHDGSIEISRTYANVKVQQHDNDENLQKLYQDNRNGRYHNPSTTFRPDNLYGPLGKPDESKDVVGPAWDLNGEPPQPNFVSTQPNLKHFDDNNQPYNKNNEQKPAEFLQPPIKQQNLVGHQVQNEPFLLVNQNQPKAPPQNFRTNQPSPMYTQPKPTGFIVREFAGEPILTPSTNRPKLKGFYITKQPNQNIRIPRNYYSGHLAYKEPVGSGQSYSKCPQGATGQFAYEGSCNKFLNCWKGRGYAQNCPPGTLFNGNTLECDFPDKVQCSQRSAKLLDLSQKEQANCPQGFSGIIPHYADCSKFIQCDFGRQHVMDCPPGTLFDITSNLCDFDYKVQCSSGSKASGSKTPNLSYGSNYQPMNSGNRYQTTSRYSFDQNYDQSNFEQTYQTTGRYPYGSNYDPTQFGGNYQTTNRNPFGPNHDQTNFAVNYQTTNRNPFGPNYDQSNFAGNYQTTNRNPFGPYYDQTNFDNTYQTTSRYPYVDTYDISKNPRLDNNPPNSGYGNPDTYSRQPSTLNVKVVSSSTRYTGPNTQTGIFGPNIQYGPEPDPNNGELYTGPQEPNHHTGLQGPNHQTGMFGPNIQSPPETDPYNREPHSSPGRPNSETQNFGPNSQYGPEPEPYNREPHSSPGRPNSETQNFGPNIQYGPESDPYDNREPLQGGSYTSPNTAQNSGRLTQGQNKPDKCPAGHTGLMAHSDCSKFMNCAHGQTYVQDCAPGTLFNGDSKICDFPYKVKCGPTTNSASNRQNPHSEDLLTGEETRYPNPHLQNYGNHPPTFQNFYDQKPNSETVEVFLTTTTPKTPKNDGVGYKSKHWPPPFPSTDTNADYVFEYEDFDEVEVNHDPAPKIDNWCDRKGYECGNKICIDPSLVCDGKTDCPYGNDEYQCDIPIRHYQLTQSTKLAVKESKKVSNITVKWCAKICSMNYCKGFNYRKHDGTCYILDSNVAQSGALIMLPMYDYYEDQRQTKTCEQLKGFLCPNRKCITHKQLCDGLNDCGDGTDEKGCPSETFNYTVKLAGGPDAHSGRLEVSAFGRTGYICDDMFGLRNADVACKELGFKLGAAEVKGNSFFAHEISDNDTLYMMDDVSCVGNETSLKDCDFAGWGTHNCRPQEIVGVVCKNPKNSCPNDHWQCRNNLECLPLAFVCDGVYDCSDKSDEDPVQCDSEIGIRLSGINGTKGRLEIQYHGIWGTVCDDDFNDDAAKVVCRQLGFDATSAKVVKDGLFGPGNGPIWLDQVFCKGNESSLQNCLHWDWGEHNCEHSEDVGVICSATSSSAGEPRNMDLENQQEEEEDDDDLDRLPETCGLRSDAIFDQSAESDVHFRVVQSPVAKKGEYPWQASIRVSGKTKSAHWCGAIVISPRYILTAAHCLRGFTKGAYYVVAGDYNVDKDEGTEQKAFIDDFIVHEHFGEGNKMNNDIALIRLKGRGFKLDRNIRPICLPDQDLPPTGTNCTISGFGSIESGRSRASKDLRAGWIPILAKAVCQMPHVYGEAITDQMICAGFLNKEGVDACDGDSGGPLACLHEGLFKLYGITSWGQHCGHANKPGVYVNVVKYRKWITDTMKQLSKNSFK